MAKDSKRYQLAIKKGNEFNEGKKWQEAVGAFRVAIAEFNDRPEAYAGLGFACMGLKQLNRALDCYILAARYGNGDAEYLNMVADIQERLGQLHDAGRTYMAAGEFYFRENDNEAAKNNWLRAVRLEPNLLGAHQRLAVAFQKENNVKAAVREYLAIARILAMQGNSARAMKICRAAMRLDPDNPDIVTAIKLISQGENAYPEEEPEIEEPIVEEKEEPAADGDSIFETVRQMAEVLESEKDSWQLSHQKKSGGNPIAEAKSAAKEALAAEIFREEEDEDYSADGMIKLERDALIGQAMDFQSRGEVNKAIGNYQKAIDGGLDISAAHFMIGMLYMESDQEEAALQSLEKASQDEAYTAAVRQVLAGEG